MVPIRVALIGFGKIAKDQHLPAILADPAFEPAAIVTPIGDGVAGIPLFRTIAEARASGIAIDAAVLCNRPVDRRRSAFEAIAAGWHLMMEKPPGLTMSEVDAIAEAAEAVGRTLFTAWHSRWNAAVTAAAQALNQRTPCHIAIDWREDVDIWHPGQAWIWEPGGFGVFDPGINALAIVTQLFADRWLVDRCDLSLGADAQTPMIARFGLSSTARALTLDADFDWSAARPDIWSIRIDCDEGPILLLDGGRSLWIDGAHILSHEDDEYAALYRRFARLIADRARDVDARPLEIVIDALATGSRAEIAQVNRPPNQ